MAINNISNIQIGQNNSNISRNKIVKPYLFQGNVNNSADSVELSTKKSIQLSKAQKILIGTASGLTLLAGCIFGGKKLITANKLKKLEARFVELLDDVPKTQREFKNIFRRSDITEEETVNMLNRYKELEQMRIKGKVSKEDYIKQMFDTALSNFGLSESGIKLNIKALDKNVAGHWDVMRHEIAIDPKSKIDDILGTIHHEFRHAKQSEAIAKNFSEEEYLELLKLNMYENSTIGKNYKTYEEYLKGIWTKDFEEAVIEENVRPALRRFRNTKSVAPTNDLQYAQDMLRSLSSKDIFNNFGNYWKSVHERDARYAGTKISKLLGVGERPWIEKYDLKYIKDEVNFDVF